MVPRPIRFSLRFMNGTHAYQFSLPASLTQIPLAAIMWAIIKWQISVYIVLKMTYGWVVKESDLQLPSPSQKLRTAQIWLTFSCHWTSQSSR